MPPFVVGGGKRVPKRRSTWTGEDSKKELERWTKIRETDPAVQTVHKTLEENLNYFMAEVGTLVQKYEKLRDQATEDKSRHQLPLCATAPPEGEATSDLVVVRVLRPAATKIPGEKEKTGTTSTPASPITTTTTAAEGDDQPKVAEEDDDSSVDDNTSATSEHDASPESKTPVFPCNKEILETFTHLKREAYELNVTFTGIHDWIALSLPDLKMEEEDTMEILDTMMTQVSGLDETLQGVYQLENKYIETRTDIECEMLKYPDVISLPELLGLADNVAWEDVIHGFTSMIRVVIILHTYLTRNMKTLRNPKSVRGGGGGVV